MLQELRHIRPTASVMRHLLCGLHVARAAEQRAAEPLGLWLSLYMGRSIARLWQTDPLLMIWCRCPVVLLPPFLQTLSAGLAETNARVEPGIRPLVAFLLSYVIALTRLENFLRS